MEAGRYRKHAQRNTALPRIIPRHKQLYLPNRLVDHATRLVCVRLVPSLEHVSPFRSPATKHIHGIADAHIFSGHAKQAEGSKTPQACTKEGSRQEATNRKKESCSQENHEKKEALNLESQPLL